MYFRTCGYQEVTMVTLVTCITAQVESKKEMENVELSYNNQNKVNSIFGGMEK